MLLHSAKKVEEEGREGICLPVSPPHVKEPGFPGDGWTTACNGKWWKNFLFCFAWLSLYLSNCLYINPQFLSLLPFWFSSSSKQEAVSEWLERSDLLAGVKPQQHYNMKKNLKIICFLPDVEYWYCSWFCFYLCQQQLLHHKCCKRFIKSWNSDSTESLSCLNFVHPCYPHNSLYSEQTKAQ